MQVPVTALGSVIAGLAMITIRSIKVRRCEIDSRNYAPTAFCDRVFRNSWTSYFWFPPAVGFGVYILASTRSHPHWFPLILGMGAILGGVATIPVFMSSCVRIKSGEVTLVDCGRVRGSLKLDDILSVTLDGSSFKVRARWDRGLVLPMGTENDALLLAMLRGYRVNQAPQTSQG